MAFGMLRDTRGTFGEQPMGPIPRLRRWCLLGVILSAWGTFGLASTCQNRLDMLLAPDALENALRLPYSPVLPLAELLFRLR